jgi:hypothetical protein
MEMDMTEQKMMQEQEFKYYAFISYNSKDTVWGKRVQRKLEHYRMPATLCSERGWKRTPIRPVFFAPTDIQPGGLTDELQERLKASRNLIVICSPNSAQSDWVGKEIEFFHSLGRTENIHFFIVDGKPHSGNPETECFNPVIDKLGLPEILGANIHERNYRWPWLNKERAYVQLVSKLLGVEFDAIWQRHKRLLLRRALAWLLGIAAVIAALVAVWIGNQPFNTTVHLNESTSRNDQLPPLHNAVVTLSLDNESKTDTIQSIDENGVFTNVPHRYLDQPVHVTVACPDFLPLDTTLTLTRDVTLDIRRDPSVYGNVKFGLWDPETETFISGTRLEVAGQVVTTDKEGQVSLFVPLEQQRKTYQVKAPFPLYNDIITMPCGESDVIEKL